MSKLREIQISGFRSIKNAKLELRNLNVMIGANGAGKSNLIAFFKMMNELIAGRLQQFIGSTGRATGNLYFGPKDTPHLDATLEFEVDKGDNAYYMRLSHAARDSLIFTDEKASFHQMGFPSPRDTILGAGHQESMIDVKVAEGDENAKALRYLLRHCRVFHFHDTSPKAPVRQSCFVRACRWLMPDAANLAAVLFRLQSEQAAAYRRIVDTIQMVAPFFEDFVLEPTKANDIILDWKHRNSDAPFGPHQFSDGTLRAICLITLLMQPKDVNSPVFIAIDEPELGLHPYALAVIASLIQSASYHTQILVSTQSSTFLSNFDAEDIIVAERGGQGRDRDETTFVRPDPAMLESWLDEYSLGEIWEKNVIGGGPH